jgi:hypothetical protein
MAQLVLVVGLEFARTNAMGDLAEGRPSLAAWMARLAALPSMRATA